MSAVSQGIVNSHFKAVMSRQREYSLIAGDGLTVVNHDADANTAIRRTKQGLDHQVARIVGAEYVRLGIERSLRGIDHFKPCRETIDTD